jgi:peptidoglycan/xylan/chitin deacetylase (PgdA/CDA1 family)
VGGGGLDSQTRNVEGLLNQPIPILMYHQIGRPGARGLPLRGLSVSPVDFERHMRCLARWGYQGLSMSHLCAYLEGHKSAVRTQRVFGLTFDDGFENNLHHALPILHELGFSSTCFVVSQRLGQTNVWDAHLGVVPTRLMDLSQLRQWQAYGQEVGAHTATHARLTDLATAQARQEIESSRAALQDGLGQAIDHFAYPYGAFEAAHVAMVKEAGFATACTTRRGRYLGHTNRVEQAYTLPRVPIARTTTRLHLWLKTATGYEDRRGRV